MNGFTRFSKSLGALSIAVFAVISLTCTQRASGQVFVVTQEKIDGHYLDFQPTHVALSSEPLTQRSRQELIRTIDADQGFAMRPLPLERRGITLQANGEMNPSGLAYAEELNAKGISSQPGERVVISDLKIYSDRIVFELNGGPDRKHRFLRHISIGTSPYYTTPVVNDSGPDPVGSRLTLVFPRRVPEMTPEQLRALIAPIVSFGVKSPIEAYTDTLPPVLKKAILEHHVLVGMSTDMVLYALGQPEKKIREREGQMPFEEWIYGEAPHDVQFVRINGNRVIRVETTAVGKPPLVRAENEMGDYWATQPDQNVRLVKLGDQDPASAAQQDARPSSMPTLRNPGEKLPTDNDKNHPSMQPVQFPQQQKDTPPASQGAPAPAKP